MGESQNDSLNELCGQLKRAKSKREGKKKIERPRKPIKDKTCESKEPKVQKSPKKDKKISKTTSPIQPRYNFDLSEVSYEADDYCPKKKNNGKAERSIKKREQATNMMMMAATGMLEKAAQKLKRATRKEINVMNEKSHLKILEFDLRTKEMLLDKRERELKALEKKLDAFSDSFSLRLA